ncbi:glycosyltransferase [Planctomycetota bacterium]
MKLLILTHNPTRPSFRQRVEIYIEALRGFGVFCEVAKFPSGELARYKLIKLAREFDAVLLQKKTVNLIDAFWLGRYAKKIIFDIDDAVMYYDERPQRKPNKYKQTWPFQRTVKLADMVIAGNSYLAGLCEEFNNNVKILPTGLDTDPYRIAEKAGSDGKVRLVWIGSKSTLKYLAELKPALELLGKRFDNVALRIICNEFFDLENMEVEKCQWALETQARDLVDSDIGLAPLTDNRFTKGKCGFKALQYAAAGLAAVVSPVGINAEYVVDSVTGFHAGNIEQWVEKISELIENVELRERMAGEAARRVERFDSLVVGKELAGLIGGDIEKKIGWPGGRRETKVSICIPTYNRKEYLRQTIESILSQTYQDYEIVIVDDGSTDGTKEMIEQLGLPIRYYYQQNSGDAAARNKLIELARGEYISFIDSDDLLTSDAIERMVEAAQTQEEDVIVYGPYFRIDSAGLIYSRCKRRLYSGNITERLFETILVHSCGSMFPRRILQGDSAFDTSLKICSDYALWLELSKKYRFIALDEPVFKRRRHSDNLSSASYENGLIEYEVLKKFYYETAGSEVVTKSIAMKRLSQQACRTARYAIKQGLHTQGSKLLRESLRHRMNLKAVFYLARAWVLRKKGYRTP